MDIFCFLRDYPAIGGLAIGAIFGATGWIGRSIFDVVLEKKRYKRELKTYLWKEKINASKKASEFYLEYANFLNLARIQFENFRLGKIEHESLIENFQKEVAFYAEKLKTFPHFEHHHINIFYEFDENKAMEINNKINATNREISELSPDSVNTEKASELFKILEDCYAELFDLQKGHTNRIRENLKDYV
ncbi:hypothetical protein JBL43_08055 [Aureibaculum sp. A20]|uniref:Uncharacterized protein n=1 Tax=Aureibaculum flavum TaxID=2795986 RepID=A0ABS0WQE8_9FLAO|nr:hypothetical protein [Aureibaculum flavum]MBJ2174187.1 hypothetical protein [Aureibaculum flavum]